MRRLLNESQQESGMRGTRRRRKTKIHNYWNFVDTIAAALLFSSSFSPFRQQQEQRYVVLCNISEDIQVELFNGPQNVLCSISSTFTSSLEFLEF